MANVFGDDNCRFTFVDGEPYVHVEDASKVFREAADDCYRLYGATLKGRGAVDAFRAAAMMLIDYRNHRVSVKSRER